MSLYRYTVLSALFFSSASVLANTPASPVKPAPVATQQQAALEHGIEQMFNALDKDKNKQLSYDEFRNGVMAERRQMMILERLHENFKAADKNANGTLELLEFNALPGLKMMPEPKPAFADYDLNKDQKMDFREYVEFVGKMRATPPPPDKKK